MRKLFIRDKDDYKDIVDVIDRANKGLVKQIDQVI